MPPPGGGRGRGGKFGKPTRGGKGSSLCPRQGIHTDVLLLPGGKHFSKNLTPLDADGNPVGMWGVSIPALRPHSQKLLSSNSLYI